MPKPEFIEPSYSTAVSAPDSPAAPKADTNFCFSSAMPSGVDMAR